MSIKVVCEKCGKSLQASQEHVGKRARCPGCGAPVLITAAPSSAGPPVAEVVREKKALPVAMLLSQSAPAAVLPSSPVAALSVGEAQPQRPSAKGALLPWLVAAGVGVLFAVAAVLALLGFVSANGLRQELAVAEQKARDAAVTSDALRRQIDEANRQTAADAELIAKLNTRLSAVATSNPKTEPVFEQTVPPDPVGGPQNPQRPPASDPSSKLSIASLQAIKSAGLLGLSVNCRWSGGPIPAAYVKGRFRFQPALKAINGIPVVPPPVQLATVNYDEQCDRAWLVVMPVMPLDSLAGGVGSIFVQVGDSNEVELQTEQVVAGVIPEALAYARSDIPETAKRDRQNLQGTWKVIGGEAGGNEALANVIEGMTAVFAGDTQTWAGGGSRGTASYELDSEATPKRIRFKSLETGDVSHGIYILENESLKICIGSNPPDEFRTTPGSANLLFVLQRVSPQDGPPNEARPAEAVESRAVSIREIVRASHGDEPPKPGEGAYLSAVGVAEQYVGVEVRWRGRVHVADGKDPLSATVRVDSESRDGVRLDYDALLALQEQPATPLRAGQELEFVGTVGARTSKGNAYNTVLGRTVSIVYTLPIENAKFLAARADIENAAPGLGAPGLPPGGAPSAPPGGGRPPGTGAGPPSGLPGAPTQGREPAPRGTGTPTEPLADPGNLSHYRDQIGKVYYFEVTGRDGGAVWGTDSYTDDSDLGTAAVHAGVLKVGETGVVKVTIQRGQKAYRGSSRNGIKSADYGEWDRCYRLAAAPKP